jgi:hypothetical protein
VTPKTAALVLLGVVSLVCPLVEMAVTGKVDPFGPYGLVDAFLSLPAIFWWYHVDKRQRNYRAGRLMNAGMIAFVILALPVYFVRTRGWRGGAIASSLALLVLGVNLALSEIGEWIGGFLR